MEDIGLTHDDFICIDEDLDKFRKAHNHHNMKRKLSSIPFHESDKLFSIDGSVRFRYVQTPCKAFGRQLILKIVDELIYCGLNTYDRR